MKRAIRWTSLACLFQSFQMFFCRKCRHIPE